MSASVVAPTQPEIAIAAATPTWPWPGNSSSAPTTAAASPASAVNIGVRVSSWANDTAPSTFSSTWPGRPAEIAASAAATIAVSCGPNAPRSNRPPAIGSASTAKATADGSARPSAISKARDCAAAIASPRPARTLAAITGTITEAIAIDTTPSGSS